MIVSHCDTADIVCLAQDDEQLPITDDATELRGFKSFIRFVLGST
jgi:hypothetical protein